MKMQTQGTVLSLLLLFLCIVQPVFSAQTDRRQNTNITDRIKFIKSSLAGPSDIYTSRLQQDDVRTTSLGFDRIPTNSPGLAIGTTTHDFQHLGRTNRQVEWRGDEKVHFIWFRQDDFIEGGDGGSGYEIFDPYESLILVYNTSGGCDIHPRLGEGVNFSGFPGLDIDTESKAVIYNQHDDGTGYAPTVWYDFNSAACFFSPYRSRLTDSLMNCGVILGPGEGKRYGWPSAEYQVFDGDTVTHLIAHDFGSDGEPAVVKYWRRFGSDTLGSWDIMCTVIDTVPVIGEQITASRVSRKVAISWLAPPGAYPGDPESMTRDWIDPGLGVNERTNDVYAMISYDMGSTWEPKFNVSKFDSTEGGWLGHADLSCLIDSDDNLHIVWPSRKVVPSDAGLGEFAHFYGSRMIHWDENSDMLRTVKDANWDLPDSGCTGGTWNEMSLGKPQISECDGKFYCIFVQFNDIYNGIENDCAEARFTGDAGWMGTANGEIYISVSDNGGFNWDISYNLTNTYSAHCTPDGADGTIICDADHYPSMPRFGMEVIGGNFGSIPVVDPTGGTYTGNFYLDVEYINDKFPGSCFQDDGIWTTNAVHWFRVPCYETNPNPVPIVWPWSIGAPTWTQPGQSLDTVIYIENVGNAPLEIVSITPVNVSHEGGFSVDNPGPFTVSHLSGEPVEIVLTMNASPGTITPPAILSCDVEIVSDYPGWETMLIPVEVIIADNVQFPLMADIRTSCTRIRFNNGGNIGDGSDGYYNLNFFDDCDTTDNDPSSNDNASVYLYASSPFLCRIDGSDTILNYFMYDAHWLSDNGFRPLEGLDTDTLTFTDYQYGYTGLFCTPDTAIGIGIEYFAPTDQDSCEFIVLRETVTNLTESTIPGVFAGYAMDWDIPSDTAVANGSDYDSDLNLIWSYGAEYGADSIANDDCILADQRAGGFSYYYGYRVLNDVTIDSIPNPNGSWTENNSDWIYPANGFVPGQIYRKCQTTYGYETWEATGDFSNPDSQYTDLHMVSCYGKYDLLPGDSLLFCKILLTEYDGGGDGIRNSVNKARQWITDRNIFPEREVEPSCTMPGDVDCNGTVNLLDITDVICFLYYFCPPRPYPCCNNADVDGNCVRNILDITFLISYLYQGGGAPVCGCVCAPGD